jgi:hypothetical protein
MESRRVGPGTSSERRWPSAAASPSAPSGIAACADSAPSLRLARCSASSGWLRRALPPKEIEEAASRVTDASVNSYSTPARTPRPIAPQSLRSARGGAVARRRTVADFAEDALVAALLGRGRRRRQCAGLLELRFLVFRALAAAARAQGEPGAVLGPPLVHVARAAGARMSAMRPRLGGYYAQGFEVALEQEEQERHETDAREAGTPRHSAPRPQASRAPLPYTVCSSRRRVLPCAFAGQWRRAARRCSPGHHEAGAAHEQDHLPCHAVRVIVGLHEEASLPRASRPATALAEPRAAALSVSSARLTERAARSRRAITRGPPPLTAPSAGERRPDGEMGRGWGAACL